MRLPGQPAVWTLIVEALRRAPGLTNPELARRVGESPRNTHGALKRLLDTGRVEQRIVDDPCHPNAGERGYFLREKGYADTSESC